MTVCFYGRYAVVKRCIVILATLTAVVSCKSVRTTAQVAENSEKQTATRIDTVVMEKRDTLYVYKTVESRDSSAVMIEFNAGGGQMNAQTGEISGIRAVKVRKMSEGRADERASEGHREKILMIEIDSLRHEIDSLQTVSSAEQTAAVQNGVPRFYVRCTIGFFIMIIAAIAHIAVRIWLKR